MRKPEKNKTSFFIRGFTQSAFLTVISRISGFIRDIFIAGFLGAGIFSDIFLIAFKLPNLFRRITAEGALTSAFLPIYSKLKIQNGEVLAFIYFKEKDYLNTEILLSQIYRQSLKDDEFQFKFAYSLFVNGKYDDAKYYFNNIKDNLEEYQ